MNRDKILFNKIKDKILFNKLRYTKFFFGMSHLLKYNEQEEMMRIIMEYVKFSKVTGLYMEFGVSSGNMFSIAYNFANRAKLNNMEFCAFDSFEGLPTSDDYFLKGQYKCSEKNFRKNIKSRGVDTSKVYITNGWFSDTLNSETKKKLPNKKASIILIDCDLYDATKDVLNFITSYIQDGTVIIFDDWFLYKGHSNKGEQKAFAEWLCKHPNIKAVEFRRYCLGTSFILNINGKKA